MLLLRHSLLVIVSRKVVGKTFHSKIRFDCVAGSSADLSPLRNGARCTIVYSRQS